MNSLRKLPLLVKEIGLPDLLSYGIYKFQKRSGLLQLRTPAGGFQHGRDLPLEIPLEISKNLIDWQSTSRCSVPTLLHEEAALLLEGKFRPFFGETQELSFPQKSHLDHWTTYQNEFEGQDIKFTWEPARFTWSLALARAYQSTQNERYARIFWQKFEEFTSANPVNFGPNWASAQEVALRLVMWILTIPAFNDAPSTTPARLTRFVEVIQQHLERIPPTLAYARSQRNNHILSEALGLMLGGDFLRKYDPRGERWMEMGRREFERALLRQVDAEGNYSQHSANYQRMMLQLALLYNTHMKKNRKEMPGAVQKKLELAARWLIAQLDATSGRLPNLGHNDGTLLLPFGCVDYRDYRPTAQAAAIAFLNQPRLPAGPWDDLSSWLRLQSDQPVRDPWTVSSPGVHKVGTPDCWGTLRGVRYQNRPAHADQLHVEVWYAGENLARDAGTYLYNSALPWQNALDVTRVHNTITIDGKDQMKRVSRFLWLDQAQAKWKTPERKDALVVEHDGFRDLGIVHQRALEYHPPADMLVTDSLIPSSGDPIMHHYRLHWLLPDWEWTIEDMQITLRSTRVIASLRFNAVSLTDGNPRQPVDFSLLRAGKTLVGQLNEEILGWESETYGEKHPALSLSLLWHATEPVKITTEWKMVRL